MYADGWLDLCTSAPGYPFACAVAGAAAELMVTAVCLVIGLRTQQDADGRRSDDLRLPAGPAVARRTGVGAGPGPDVARAGCASVGAGPVRAY